MARSPSPRRRLSCRAGSPRSDAGVGHPARERLGQEVGDDRLDPSSLRLHREIRGLRWTQARPRGRHRPQEIGTLLLGALQLGEERARGAECRVVGGGAVAIDRPDAERPRLALAGDLLGGLASLERERRDHVAVGDLAHLRKGRDHHRRRREDEIAHERGAHEGQPASQVESDGRDKAAPRFRARQVPITRRHQPLWSSA